MNDFKKSLASFKKRAQLAGESGQDSNFIGPTSLIGPSKDSLPTSWYETDRRIDRSVQRALNVVLSNGGRHFTALTVDGDLGSKTREAIRTFIQMYPGYYSSEILDSKEKLSKAIFARAKLINPAFTGRDDVAPTTPAVDPDPTQMPDNTSGNAFNGSKPIGISPLDSTAARIQKTLKRFGK
jgi:hypothetical protein